MKSLLKLWNAVLHIMILLSITNDSLSYCFNSVLNAVSSLLSMTNTKDVCFFLSVHKWGFYDMCFCGCDSSTGWPQSYKRVDVWVLWGFDKLLLQCWCLPAHWVSNIVLFSIWCKALKPETLLDLWLTICRCQILQNAILEANSWKP